MPRYQGRDLTPEEYVSVRLGITYPPNWKEKMVVMANLLERWEGALKYAIMGTFDDEYDANVSDLFDAWARGELDIIECAQRQIAYEIGHGIFDEHGKPRGDMLEE